MGWVLFSFHLQRSYSLVVFNQCATLYLVRIFSAARCAGFRQEKSPGRVGRCRIEHGGYAWESRRKGAEETLCIRYVHLSGRLQANVQHCTWLGSPMCAASGGSSTWGNTWERTYSLVVSDERATVKANCFTKRNSIDIIAIGSFASEVETVLLHTLWVKRDAGRGTPA